MPTEPSHVAPRPGDVFAGIDHGTDDPHVTMIRIADAEDHAIAFHLDGILADLKVHTDHVAELDRRLRSRVDRLRFHLAQFLPDDPPPQEKPK